MLNEFRKKLCKGCDKSKFLIDFSPNPSSYDGVQSQCKLCRNAKARAVKRKRISRLNPKLTLRERMALENDIQGI